MPAITISGLSDESYRVLSARVTVHGRSIEAEVQCILDEAIAETENFGFGTRLARAAASVGGFDLRIERDGVSNSRSNP